MLGTSRSCFLFANKLYESIAIEFALGGLIQNAKQVLVLVRIRKDEALIVKYYYYSKFGRLDLLTSYNTIRYDAIFASFVVSECIMVYLFAFAFAFAFAFGFARILTSYFNKNINIWSRNYLFILRMVCSLKGWFRTTSLLLLTLSKLFVRPESKSFVRSVTLIFTCDALEL